MEQIRIAFWIVTLAVFCLNIQGKPVTKRSIVTVDWNIKLLKRVSCIDGSEFYAPKNIEKECFINALECVTLELERTNESEECTDVEKRIPQGLKALDYISQQLKAMDLKRDNSSKCNCELWPEKNFADFVTDVKSLLQQISTEV